MAQLLQRILVDRDERFLFQVSGTRYMARVDYGNVRGDFEILCRAFAQPGERNKIRRGWRIGLADVWRRRQNLIRKGNSEWVRFLHFQKPDGTMLVLDFYYQPLPMQIVNELKAFLASFDPKAAPTRGESHAQGQSHGQPDAEAQRDPAAEGDRREHVEVDEGRAASQGDADGLAAHGGSEDSAIWRGLGVEDGD